MPPVRGPGPRARGVRQGLLTGLAPILLLSVYLLSNCSRGRGALNVSPPGGAAASWFILSEGVFEPVASLQPEAFPARKPWTVQARVADLALDRGAVFMGVNGHGICRLTWHEGGPRFTYFYEPSIFQYRTLTTLIPNGRALLCHLYFNRLLNVVSAEELKIKGLSLLRFLPEDGVYRPLSLPFQREHPDWEPVGFVAESPDRIHLEWKLSGPEKTLFGYTLYRPDENDETTSDVASFRRAFLFQGMDDEALPMGLKRLFRAALARRGPAADAYHVLARMEGNPLVRRFRLVQQAYSSPPKKDYRLLTLRLFQNGSLAALLFPEGTLLLSRPGEERIRSSRLPPLPADCTYRDFLIQGAHLLAVWEEAKFIDVGGTGILLFPLSALP